MTDGPAYTQNTLRKGFVEFAFGEPDPALLPVGLVRGAAARALREDGPGLLAYGQSEGPPGLRAAIARRVEALESRRAAATDILISAGNSQALELVLTVLTRPGDVVLVESPTYNLALGTIRDHAVELAGVPLDGDGLDVDALERRLDELSDAGRHARLLYTIPTFHNPAGVCLSPARRARLLALARARDLVLVEDDVYRDLVYEGEAPPSLRSDDEAAPVVRLGSFSKSLAPGLRTGWIDARADLRERLVAAGVLESGGCPSQFAAGVVGALLDGGGYDEHIAELRAAYAERRDALTAALREHLPAGCEFFVPAGGFFIWLRLPPGVTATELLPFAEERRVSFAPGRRFCCDGRDDGLRLAFSLYPGTELAEGGRRLGAALRATLRAQA